MDERNELILAVASSAGSLWPPLKHKAASQPIHTLQMRSMLFWTAPNESDSPNNNPPSSSEANDRLKARILARQQSTGNHDTAPTIPEEVTHNSSFLSSLNPFWPSDIESAPPPPVITTPKNNPEISSSGIPGLGSIPSVSTINDSEKKMYYSIPVIQTPSSRIVPKLMIPKQEPMMTGTISASPKVPHVLAFNGAPDVHTSSSSSSSSSSVVPPSFIYQNNKWPSRIPDEDLTTFQQQYLAVEQERNELLAEKQARIDMIGGHNPLLEKRLKELESRLKMNDDKVIQLTAEKDYLCDALKVAQGQTAASYELVNEKQKMIDELEKKHRSHSTRDTGQLINASSLLDNAGAEIKHLQDLVNAKQQKIDELARENRVNEYGYHEKLQGAKDMVDGARAEIKHLHDRIALLERNIVNPSAATSYPPPPSHPSHPNNLMISSTRMEVLDAISPVVKGTTVGNKNVTITPPGMLHPADQRWIDAAFDGSNVNVTDTSMKDRLHILEAAAVADKKKMADLQIQLERAEKKAKRRSCWC